MLSYQDVLFLTAASATVLIILLRRLVMFEGRLKACLDCGCQLNTGAKVCLICGHTRNPRVPEGAIASVRPSASVGLRVASGKLSSSAPVMIRAKG